MLGTLSGTFVRIESPRAESRPAAVGELFGGDSRKSPEMTPIADPASVSPLCPLDAMRVIGRESHHHVHAASAAAVTTPFDQLEAVGAAERIEREVEGPLLRRPAAHCARDVGVLGEQALIACRVSGGTSGRPRIHLRNGRQRHPGRRLAMTANVTARSAGVLEPAG